MGVVMGLVRVRPEQLDRAMSDAEVALEVYHDAEELDDLDGYLDKAWDGLRFLLQAAGVRDLMLVGRVVPVDPDAGFMKGWIPADVEWAAQQLRATPFAQLAPHFDPAVMRRHEAYPDIWDNSGELGYLRRYYEVLVRFFDAAAASGSAAIGMIFV